MQAMSLRSLSVVAILWTVGVAILATKIGGFPTVLIIAVFILPLVFSSIDAAWQASFLTPSLSHSRKSHPIGQPEPVESSAEEATPDTEPAVPQSVIPDPRPATPEPDEPEWLDLDSPLPEPAFQVGETLRL